MKYTVAVVGGGVIGLSIAWRTAARGFSVTMYDPDPGHGASWVAGGMLAPTAEAYHGEEGVLRFGLASRARYPSFVAELEEDAGRDAGYTEQGTLLVARDADDAAEIRRLFDLQQAMGLPAEWRTSSELRRLEPALARTVRGGVWMPLDHQVDNRRLIKALCAACSTRGVCFERQSAVEVTSSSVRLSSGELSRADHVVVATGANPSVVMDDGALVTLPVRPVKGQILRLRSVAAAVCPSHTVRGLGIYVIPRSDGEIVVGATSEEKGFDTTVTAGAVMDLLRDAWELVPGIAEAELVEAKAGLRPGTPDNLPIIGRVGCEGSGPIVAVGHYRHGILFAPLTAELVTGLLTDSSTSEHTELLKLCEPARFEAREVRG
ncbi:MAG: glycine oxidase ThiO [Acidimicrobiales bacterium]|nr:glycine oxidase ThiO [Acidimicrobiales bacterium]